MPARRAVLGEVTAVGAFVARRDRAKALPGPNCDVRDFNDAPVATGGVPLTALSGVVDRMVAQVKAG